MENYGSIYGLFLFSFERYIGILGSYHTNNKTVEIQIVLKFMTSQNYGEYAIQSTDTVHAVISSYPTAKHRLNPKRDMKKPVFFHN